MRYDYSSINQFTAPWTGGMPGWREAGFWQYENEELDEIGQRIFTGEFTTLEERNQLYQRATRIAVEESVRLWVATVQNSFAANSGLTGVTQDLVAGPKAPWTLREAEVPGQSELTVGHLWVWTERTTWNPVGGFGDVYSTDIWRNLVRPAHLEPPLLRCAPARPRLVRGRERRSDGEAERARGRRRARPGLGRVDARARRDAGHQQGNV